MSKRTAALLIGAMLVLSACANTAFALEEQPRADRLHLPGRKLQRDRLIRRDGGGAGHKVALAATGLGAAGAAGGAALAAHGLATGDTGAQVSPSQVV